MWKIFFITVDILFHICENDFPHMWKRKYDETNIRIYIE